MVKLGLQSGFFGFSSRAEGTLGGAGAGGAAEARAGAATVGSDSNEMTDSGAVLAMGESAAADGCAGADTPGRADAGGVVPAAAGSEVRPRARTTITPRTAMAPMAPSQRRRLVNGGPLGTTGGTSRAIPTDVACRASGIAGGACGGIRTGSAKAE